MKSMSGKELAKLLEANGWDLLRIQGSHHIYGQAGNPARISVPIHRNQNMKIGLLRNLLKTAGLLVMSLLCFSSSQDIITQSGQWARESFAPYSVYEANC